jgi:hypothetical protein
MKNRKKTTTLGTEKRSCKLGEKRSNENLERVRERTWYDSSGGGEGLTNRHMKNKKKAANSGMRREAATSLREREPWCDSSARWRGEEPELTLVQGRESFGGRGYIHRFRAGHIKLTGDMQP